MPRLPALPAREIVRAFGKAGLKYQRQTGSHLILYSHPRRQVLSIPNHDPVKRGTPRALIRQAGMTRTQFLELLG